MALALQMVAPVWAQGSGPFRNVVNRRFATVSNGPQSAVVVDVPAGADTAQRDKLVADRLRATFRRQAQALASSRARIRTSGKLPLLALSQVVAVRQSGRLVVPERKTTRNGDNRLDVVFEGFNGASFLNDRNEAVLIEDTLRELFAVVYPKMVALYGKPSWSGTVVVKSMGFLEEGLQTDLERLSFGAYNVSEGRIYLPLFRSIDSIAHAFVLNLFHAFHGPVVLHYDAWEQGMARAAATVLARDPAINFLDPTANGLLTQLPVYDLLNQPALGNSTFFPPSQANFPVDGVFTIARMLQPRLGMSGAAWLKVYIENPGFFAAFNSAYYAAAASDSGLPGNVPALRTLAGSVVPTVEGLSFGQWFERQYVLDTSVTGGDKVYAFVVPGDNVPAGPVDPGGQSHLMVVVHYRTEVGGDEKVRSGRVYATYFDHDGYRIPTLGPASEQATVDQGEGFLTTLSFPNSGVDDGRMTVDLAINGVSVRTWLPSALEGDIRVLMATPAKGATATISQVVLPSGIAREKEVPVTRGAFGAALGGVAGEFARTTVTVVNEGITKVYRRNTGDGTNVLVLAEDGVAGGVVTVTKLLPTGVPFLMSPPVRPLTPKPDAVLGLPWSDFVVTQWDPLANRYEMAVPDKPVTGAMLPGRAYWVRLLPSAGGDQHFVSITGTTPAADNDFTIPAPYGWNLIGSPFPESIEMTDVYVKFLENDAIPWSEAVESNLVALEPFAWDSANRRYVPSQFLDGSEWKGYWLRVYAPSGVTLLLPGPSAPSRKVVRSRSRSVAPLRTSPLWSFRLHARQGESAASVALGAAPGASDTVDVRWDTEMPPSFEPGFSMGFVGAGKGSGGRRVGDFRSESAARKGVWTVVLSSPVAGTVRLHWDGVGAVPRGVRLRLVDESTGATVLPAAQGSWNLELAAGQTRRLTVHAEPARTLPLTITRMFSRPGRGGGVRLELATTSDAQLDVQVVSMTGKVLRTLGGGRAKAGETTTISWDGRGPDGPLPAGSYLLQVIARDDNGAVARQVRPVTTVR